MKLRLLLIAAILAIASLAQAQTRATTTTLAADATATATVVTVTSATGFTVGNQLWVDTEQMRITSVNGTAIGVARGQNGTAARAHDNAERVITGVSDHFHTNDPDYGADCTRGVGQAAFQPWINVRTGWVWLCGSAGTPSWTATSTAAVTFNSIPTSF